jgi:hypothetical protein
MRANNEALDALHKTIAETLNDELKKYRNGEYNKSTVDENGVVTETQVPVPAALIAATIKFLKDNGTDRPDEDEPDPSDALADELPNFNERP